MNGINPLKYRTQHKETETVNNDLPKCHFCGSQENGEGNMVKNPYSHEKVFVCFNCSEIIGVFFDFFVAGLFRNIDADDRIEIWHSEEAAIQ